MRRFEISTTPRFHVFITIIAAQTICQERCVNITYGADAWRVLTGWRHCCEGVFAVLFNSHSAQLPTRDILRGTWVVRTREYV